MKKYNIFCPIRKVNPPYRRMAKATKEHTFLPNLLNRQFKQKVPGSKKYKLNEFIIIYILINIIKMLKRTIFRPVNI